MSTSLPLSDQQREQIWNLLNHHDAATQRQGLELLASLEEKPQGSMIYRGMPLGHFEFLRGLMDKTPDVLLNWIEAGYERIAAGPLDGLQFLLIELLERRFHRYNKRLLGLSQEAWDALGMSEQWEQIEAVGEKLKALGVQLLEEAGDLDACMPEEAQEHRISDWYGWVRVHEAGSKDPEWLRTRTHVRSWLGEDGDTPKGRDVLAFVRSLPQEVRHEILRPIMINEWNRPIVCFRASFQGVLIELFCENQERVCQYYDGSFYRVKDIEAIDLSPYADRAYCNVTGRPPTKRELKALASLPALDSIRFTYKEGMDLSPLASAPMLCTVEIHGGPDQATLDKIDLGTISVLQAEGDDPEYGEDELYDENGDFNLELHSCEVCGKIADEWGMSRTDMLVTQNTEDNFHCQACHSQLMGWCEPCSMTAPSAFLEFETFVDGALKLVEREGSTPLQLCEDCL